jgi:hypothetical protein
MSAALVSHSTTPARAASMVVVNNLVDVAGVPGDCSTTGVGSCSLRQAVQFANQNAGTTIMIQPGRHSLTLPGADNEAATGDLDIRLDTTIVGAGADTTVIEADLPIGMGDRIFDMFPSGAALHVSISGVTLWDGEARDTFGGGAIWIGTNTEVSLSDSVLLENTTRDAVGGGIEVARAGAKLTVTRTTFVENEAFGSPETAVTAKGGAIHAALGQVEIVDSRFTGNRAAGPIAGPTGTRGGTGQGGALMIEAGATARVERSLIDGNIAQGGLGSNFAGKDPHGGQGIGGGISAVGPLTMFNTTVVGNRAEGGTGAPATVSSGGFADAGGLRLAGARIVNSTVANNSAIAGTQGTNGAPFFANEGGVAHDKGTTLANTIVAANHVVPVDGNTDVDLSDVSALDGHNLFGIADGAVAMGATNLVGTSAQPLDPKLDLTLADRGGPTPTIALKPASPAINAGDASVCAGPAGGIDQRGVARPQPAGGACDIGAYEFEFAPTAVALSSSLNPSPPGQSVTFTASVSSTSGTPTGIVTFRDGSTVLGGGTLASGVVAVATSALTAGVHSITATYEGDTVFNGAVASLMQYVGTTPGLQFFPLAKPVRLLDTRPAHQAIVAPGAALVANQPLALPGRFTADGVTVPATALALVGNATVDNTAGVPAGFATLWPSGSPLPLASNLNFVPGTVRPNAFTVGLGADGQFNLLSNQGGHFIVDITGYFAPPGAGGLYYHPLAQPVRLLDTRAGSTALVAPNAPLSAGQALNVHGRFTSPGGSVPATARALVGNATVDNRVGAPPGFATLYPGGTDLPPTSNLNFAAGTIAPNAFTVALGGDGSFNLYSNTGGDFIVDVTGYYDDQAAGGLLFHPLATPVRELDTRSGFAAAVHPDKPVDAGTAINLPGSFTVGATTVPVSAAALVGNATVDNSVGAPDGFATLYPGGGELPLASNLNYSPGLVAPNAFVVGLGPARTYNLYSQSTTNFIVDISGYFAPSG